MRIEALLIDFKPCGLPIVPKPLTKAMNTTIVSGMNTQAAKRALEIRLPLFSRLTDVQASMQGVPINITTNTICQMPIPNFYATFIKLFCVININLECKHLKPFSDCS